MLAALLPATGAYGGPARETVVALRVHGNQSMSADEVLALAGIRVGDIVGTGRLEAVARRLEASGRFETVEVRKRYRSLTATDRITVIIVVRERPRASIRSPVVRSLARLASQSMFLPIIRHDEGYGWSYGARFTLVDGLGRNSRVSAPVTWGGDKRMALEADRSLSGAVFARVRGGASYGRRTHPYFGVEDRRSRVWAAVERRLPLGVRAGAEVAWEDVAFGIARDRLARLTVDLEYEGRAAGAFPRDDVRLRAAVERFDVAGSLPAVVRPRLDARVFKGVGGRTVLAARVFFEGASAPLPPYERPLLGGRGTLRGWPVGARVGDRLLAASVELRLPISSPLSQATTGFRIFHDTAAVYDAGRSVRDQRFLRGAGGGVFLTFPLGSLFLDVGHDLRGSVRLHAGAEFGWRPSTR